MDVGTQVDNFTLIDQDDTSVSLDDYKGKWVVLYFYPKDDTPDCTIEANEFSAQQESFVVVSAIILGVSPDSAQSHTKFCQKI